MQLAQQMIARRNGQQATGGQNPAPPNRQGQQQGRPAPAPPQNVANQYPSQAAVPGQQQYASQAAVAAQNLQYANAAAAQAQSQRNAAAAAQSQQQYAANQAAAATAQQAQQARERQVLAISHHLDATHADPTSSPSRIQMRWPRSGVGCSAGPSASRARRSRSCSSSAPPCRCSKAP